MKTVLVTGALRGIGRAISLRLAAEGYAVALNARKEALDRAESLKAKIEESGGEAFILSFDVSSREECREAIEGCMEERGAFWGIVLNAGICRDNLLAAMSGEQWDSVMRTNLDGFYNVLQPAILKMCKKREGRIVVISSVSGIAGNKGQANYSAAKAGLIGAAKALALEVASRNITVNAVVPGIIDTDMIEGLPLEEMQRMIPLGRLGKPSDVAAITAFLLSEEAGYITRQAISVNGGMI